VLVGINVKIVATWPIRTIGHRVSEDLTDPESTPFFLASLRYSDDYGYARCGDSTSLTRIPAHENLFLTDGNGLWQAVIDGESDDVYFTVGYNLSEAEKIKCLEIIMQLSSDLTK
jgi:hypothetical protein